MKDISKQDLFEFIVRLGIFSSMQMDWHCFGVMNKTACALLEEAGLMDEFTEFSTKEMKIPRHIMPAGSC